MLSGILSAADYIVIEAADAASGFAAALAQKPDVILSDFMMPGMFDAPGKKLFENLSSHPRTKDIPVIIASALPKETIQNNVPKHLWNRILTKPFDYLSLQSVIEDVLKRK